MIERGELGAWLRLSETPELGRESARRLLAAFGSPEAAIAAPRGARQEVVGARAAAALDQPAPTLVALLDSTWAWLAADPQRRDVIPLGDPRYPTALLEAPDPPLLLHVIGRAALLQADSLAIVGSRHATPQGLMNAQAFAQHLGGAGLTIVSGLALGIDAAAHVGALDGGSASTIAVVGTGLDQIYPKRNQRLWERITVDGLIVSEYTLGMPPLAANFPQRNRIIAGLARGTLVVEAALQSGSLITARLANEAGREVFAIPGSIHAPQSRGCHALIKQGAKLVETAQDILDELRLTPPGARGAVSAAETLDVDDALLSALGHAPVTLDALAARTGRSAADLSVQLLDLELAGQVARLPGQLFQRLTPGGGPAV